jgi:hypothetical protein
MFQAVETYCEDYHKYSGIPLHSPVRTPPWDSMLISSAFIQCTPSLFKGTPPRHTLVRITIFLTAFFIYRHFEGFWCPRDRLVQSTHTHNPFGMSFFRTKGSVGQGEETLLMDFYTLGNIKRRRGSAQVLQSDPQYARLKEDFARLVCLRVAELEAGGPSIPPWSKHLS